MSESPSIQDIWGIGHDELGMKKVPGPLKLYKNSN
jgi:hypothetical protein